MSVPGGIRTLTSVRTPVPATAPASIPPPAHFPGRRGFPFPALAVGSRSAHGDTRWCVPCYVCTVLGCPLPRLTRPFASELISTAPDEGVDSCSPRPILVTGSRRPGNYLLLLQFRRPARLLDADV